MSGFNPVAFVAQIGFSYLLGRIGAPDGPRLQDQSPASGEYGVAMPRVYGSGVRITCPIIAMSEIKETEHEVEDYSEVVGAISGAATGFMIGGPIGAAIGAVVGFIGGALTPNQKFYTYSYPGVACLIADRHKDAPIEDVLKLWANGRVLFDAAETPGTTTTDGDGLPIVTEYPKNRYFGKLRIYHGGRDQTPDSILETHIGEQPAYKGRAYLVMEDLQLENFGNAFPSPLEALVQARTDHTLADICGSICAEAGIDTISNLSTSDLIDITVRGYAVTSETNCWDAIKPFLPVYRIDAGEVGGQIRFYERAQGMRASIDSEDMGAYEYGNSPPERITFKRNLDMDLPRETALTFIDPSRDYQANTASSQRSEGSAASKIALNLQITLTADEGASAAATAHWDAWLGRTDANFSLTDQWLSLEPGRVYGLPVAGQRLPYRVTRRLRGANGIIEAEAVSDENVTYTATISGASPPVDNESTLFADTVVVPMDMPMQSDDHDDFGFYVAVGASKPYWTRGTVEVSGDGVNFAKMLDVTQTAVMGTVANALEAGSSDGLDDTLDTTSTLTVTLLHDGMTLESATDAQLDAWANFAFVGADGTGEYVQFKTATKLAPRTWLLTNLRRGRRGTDHALATHADDEMFVLLGEGGIYRKLVTDDMGWGDTLTFRGVTLHQDAADADEVTFVNSGEGKRPFSPVDLDGTFVSNDLQLAWTRRARFFDGELNTDAPETYELDISRNGVIVRTETVTSPAYTYTVANQTADGFTEGDAITVCVHQVNTDYGRSRSRCGAFIQDIYIIHMEDGTTPIFMEDDFTPIGLG